MESGNGKLDDAYNEIDDSYAEIDDTYAEIDDTYAEIDDTYAEIDDTYVEIDDTYAEIDDTYAEINDVYEEIDPIEQEISATTTSANPNRPESLGYFLRRRKIGDWNPKYTATVACIVIWVVMILIPCIALSFSNKSDDSRKTEEIYCEPGKNCSCPKGMEPNVNQTSCIDINECEEDRNGCDHYSVNEDGGFHCTCSHGFNLLSTDNRTCVDINECEEGRGGCEHQCVNEEGGFHCTCPYGYTLRSGDNRTCIDIDECEEDTDRCDHYCFNLEGGFNCTCAQGSTLSSRDSKTCIDINECEEGRGGCSHYCVKYEGGYHCTCAHGFIISSSDKRTCIDINECKEDNGGCDHYCVNSEGGFHCTCANGLPLSNDSKTCEIDETSRGKLLVLAGSAVTAGPLSSSNQDDFDIVANFTSQKTWQNCMDFSPRNQMFYVNSYMAGDQDKVLECEYDGIPICLIENLGYLQSLAVDWMIGNIYISYFNSFGIVLCTPDGKFCTRILEKSIREPWNIELDPIGSRLFFTALKGENRTIWRSGMDGSDAVNIVPDAGYARALSFDSIRNDLYWIDGETDHIEGINIITHKRYSDKIHSFDVRRPHDIRNIRCSTGVGRSLSISHPSLSTRSFPNPCETSPCSHICVPKPSNSANPTYACLCPNGYEFEESSLSSCIPSATYRNEKADADKYAKINTSLQQPAGKNENKMERRKIKSGCSEIILILRSPNHDENSTMLMLHPRICAEKLKKLCSGEQYPCENGGSCNANNTTFPCSCTPWFKGLFCEVVATEEESRREIMRLIKGNGNR